LGPALRIDDPVSEWRYAPSLNFYRNMYRNQALRIGRPARHRFPARGKRAYVLYYPDSRDFIQQQKLRVLYYNPQSQAAIAVQPCPTR